MSYINLSDQPSSLVHCDTGHCRLDQDHDLIDWTHCRPLSHSIHSKIMPSFAIQLVYSVYIVYNTCKVLYSEKLQDYRTLTCIHMPRDPCTGIAGIIATGPFVSVMRCDSSDSFVKSSLRRELFNSALYTKLNSRAYMICVHAPWHWSVNIFVYYYYLCYMYKVCTI